MKKILLIIAVMFFAGYTLAAEYDLYGNIGMGGWWMKTERFYDDSVGIEIDTNVTPYDTSTVMEADSIPLVISNFKPYGTFGVRFKGGVFGGCIELGVLMNTYDSKLAGSPTFLQNYTKRGLFISMRNWYAEWYINDYFTLLMGQDETPTHFSLSNQAFMGGRGLHNVGVLSTGIYGAYPMFQLSIHDAKNIVEGKIAVIKVDTTAVEYLNNSGHNMTYLCENGIPKIELSVGLNIDKDFFGFQGKAAGGLQRYKSVVFRSEVPADDARLPITSWVAGADLGLKIGPIKLGCDMFYGQNIGAYGVIVGDEWGWWRILDDIDDSRPFYYMQPFYPIHVEELDSNWTPIDSSFYNSRAFEIAAVFNIKPIDLLSFECGGGMVMGEHEYEEYDKNWATTYAWYAQIEVTLFENLKITPEVGQYIYGPTFGYGRYFYAGLGTRIEF